MTDQTALIVIFGTAGVFLAPTAAIYIWVRHTRLKMRALVDEAIFGRR